MKVAVYAIALNEEQFVDSFVENCKDADVVVVADTGSTDRTVERFAAHGISCYRVSIKPWRFDDSRNVALSLVPAGVDWCIQLDMDERLSPGWRKILEETVEKFPKTTRLSQKFVFGHNPDGSDGLQFYRENMHVRHGYRWVHPVHEVLMPDRIEEVVTRCELEVHHWPDTSKSRGQYLPLLAQSVKERPDDDRNAHYYARELFYYGRLEEATVEFKRHLALPSARWLPERASSMRYLAKCDKANALQWLTSAVKEAPGRREALVELACYHYELKAWGYCLAAALCAIGITERTMDYICEDWAWGSLPYDYAAISAYNLGLAKEAKEYGAKALEIEPSNIRLAKNCIQYNLME